MPQGTPIETILQTWTHEENSNHRIEKVLLTYPNGGTRISFRVYQRDRYITMNIGAFFRIADLMGEVCDDLEDSGFDSTMSQQQVIQAP